MPTTAASRFEPRASKDPPVARGGRHVVVSNRLAERPNRVAIYGWHTADGRPIQPLTIVHVDWYVDYSHGVRLVRDTLEIGGQRFKIAELLADPEKCGLVSDEGPMTPPRYPAD